MGATDGVADEAAGVADSEAGVAVGRSSGVVAAGWTVAGETMAGAATGADSAPGVDCARARPGFIHAQAHKHAMGKNENEKRQKDRPNGRRTGEGRMATTPSIATGTGNAQACLTSASEEDHLSTPPKKRSSDYVALLETKLNDLHKQKSAMRPLILHVFLRRFAAPSFFDVFRGFPSVTHGYKPTPLRG